MEIERKDGKIKNHIRKKWFIETPEERVRQEYLLALVNQYGYELEQIAEEKEVTGKGSAQARADFVIWKTVSFYIIFVSLSPRILASIFRRVYLHFASLRILHYI